MRLRKIVVAGTGCLVLVTVAVGSAVGVGTPQVTSTPESSSGEYPDFDGKAGADIPVGVPGDRGGVGSVEIRYGGATAGALRAPDGRPGDRFGSALTVSDLNADGRTDLLVGAPGRDAGGVTDAGSIYVFLGSEDRLVHSTTLELGTGGMPGPAQPGARFGTALANHSEGRLVAGLPKYDVGVAKDAGAFVEFDLEAGVLYHQDSAGIPGGSETGDHLGAAVSGAGTGGRSVFVGAPGEDNGSIEDAGAVLQGSWPNDGDPTWQRIEQDTAGVPGHSEAGDQFGAAVSPHYIGVPGEDLGTVADAGAVTIDRRTYGQGFFSISQDTEEVPGAAEQGDRFGAALVTKHETELIVLGGVNIGVPGEDLGTVKDAGLAYSIFVDYGDEGLRLGGDVFSAASGGGQPTAGAQFGTALAHYYLNLDDYRSILVFGAPGAASGMGEVVYKDFDDSVHRLTKAGTPVAGDAYGRAL